MCNAFIINFYIVSQHEFCTEGKYEKAKKITNSFYIVLENRFTLNFSNKFSGESFHLR